MSLYEQVSNLLATPDWGFGPGPTDNTLVTGFEGDSGAFIVAVAVREEQSQLVFYAYAPEATPGERLGAMMELVTRANYGMVVGNFELDLADGEVRFKVGVELDNLDDPTVVLPAHLGTCIRSLDMYLPAIAAVQEGRLTPVEALAAVEDAGEDDEGDGDGETAGS